jgi:hypothetical protein
MKPRKSRLVDVSKLSGRFRINPDVKTFLIRADCDKCFKWECVTSYADDVKDRDFTADYYECLSCDKIICEVCAKESPKKDPRCPFCGKGKLHRLTPQKILECHTCITTSELSCPICEYLD